MDKPQSWRTKIIKPRKVGEEPPLNKDGFWKSTNFGVPRDELKNLRPAKQ